MKVKRRHHADIGHAIVELALMDRPDFGGWYHGFPPEDRADINRLLGEVAVEVVDDFRASP